KMFHLLLILLRAGKNNLTVHICRVLWQFEMMLKWAISSFQDYFLACNLPDVEIGINQKPQIQMLDLNLSSL
uniref:Uncharacterized protein n=1 Tax=Chelonoidis abingdonii TaxID=106734 RepID=A0A8C0HDI6_CHEAB